ncbi:CBS domain-containing protein [Candidatus Liberibacter africanus]|uniref:Hemolysin protein n=1 Tax=Candidatus Liberibacter africanus PTSAPSY TaxID=1277257 RepID=A0A0G3I2W2_LIBAF|nr:transporter associated domain-containing protein [Candidatus Liberibacter africanus]AKK20229.1 hemolysin protein [Candidatus Liberibacter africanus PTSAPSY]QTP64005.1 CBS domain-containing protein [Candidatus Liberibacter africanus]
MGDFKINSSECPKEKSGDIDLSDSVSRMSFIDFCKNCMVSLCKTLKKLMGLGCHRDIRSLWIDENLDSMFSETEKEIFNNVLRFREMRVGDIMVPRIAIDAVEDKATIREVMMWFEKYGRSWMLVYKNSLDNPRGMIHIRDLIPYVARIHNINWDTKLFESNLIKDILFIPSSMLVSELLRKIKESGIRIALVIDEHGGTDGLVSYGDIISSLIGYLTFDHQKSMVSAVSDNTFIVDARADLEELAKIIGADWDLLTKEQDVDSLGGLIFSVLDRIPAKGEVILEIPGFEIVVIEADVRCVRYVRIRRLLEN